MTGIGPDTPTPDAAPSARVPTPSAPLDWWRRYCDPDAGDPGVRAQLRRCRTSMDAATIPAAVTLARRLGALKRDDQGIDDRRLLAALDLARVLAHVTEHVSTRPLRAAGWKSFAGDRRESDAGDDRPVLAEARFRRLLTTGTGEEQVIAFVRLIALLGGKINVADLAKDFMNWGHPRYGDETRTRWAIDYYAAGVSAAADPTSTTAEDDA